MTSLRGYHDYELSIFNMRSILQNDITEPTLLLNAEKLSYVD